MQPSEHSSLGKELIAVDLLPFVNRSRGKPLIYNTLKCVMAKAQTQQSCHQGQREGLTFHRMDDRRKEGRLIEVSADSRGVWVGRGRGSMVAGIEALVRFRLAHGSEKPEEYRRDRIGVIHRPWME
ncbi:MAG: hypothetical protein JO329_08975 [Planctomycetaceae bacterium]|nr:hypothetical protein [Planctomycetaceae bacterium]